MSLAYAFYFSLAYLMSVCAPANTHCVLLLDNVIKRSERIDLLVEQTELLQDGVSRVMHAFIKYGFPTTVVIVSCNLARTSFIEFLACMIIEVIHCYYWSVT